MSTDSIEAERSKLQRKDRAELITIATAVGAKVPGKARKADIVDLILGGAGSAPATSPPAASPVAASESASKPAPRGGRSRKTASSDAGDSPEGGDAGSSRGDSGSNNADSGNAAAASDGDESAAPKAASPRSRSARGGAKQSAPANGTADGGSGEQQSLLASAQGAGTDGSANAAEPKATRDDAADAESASKNGGDTNTGGPRRNGGDGQGQRGQGQRGQGQQGQGQQGQGQQGQGQQGEGRNRNNRQNNDRQGGNRQNQGDGQNSAQGGDLDDDGNRRGRRRRRGRDRDGQPTGDVQNQQWEGEPVDIEGHLDLRDEGYGFLRVKGYMPSRDDVYVPAKIVRQYGLRKGDHIIGAYRPQMRNEKNSALMRVDKVAAMDPEEARKRPRFEDLTPLFPDVKMRMERPDHPQNMTARIVDLISPVGKGQRGLIVSPPKAGKTTIMKTIAQCIELNNPEVHLMVLLVDERPEEVTDMRRSIKGEVIGSTFDRPADEHTHVAEVTIERAKRLVELGKDVVIILDGITRLARAYNLAAPATGRIMSGGIDTGALYPPKKFFGAARNVEEGGSLTILATALVDTGSTMDNVIFEEFKGTGNMELRLDRKASERRIFPAIDVEASSTRHEELLFDRVQLNTVWKLRRVLQGLSADGNPSAALELLIDRMRSFPTNDMFLAEIAKAPTGA